MPTPNKHLPKIEHYGRPATRAYRALSQPIASAIPHPWPPQAPPPRAGLSGYSDAVAGVAAGRIENPLPKYHQYE